MNLRSMMMAASAVAGVFGRCDGVRGERPGREQGRQRRRYRALLPGDARRGAQDVPLRHVRQRGVLGRRPAAAQGDRGRKERRRRRRACRRRPRSPSASRSTRTRCPTRSRSRSRPARSTSKIPATTVALLKLNAVVGVTAFATPEGGVKSMGIQCALCHSTVDDSFAPGIGKRLDGWANRDLNVGAIVSLAPNLKPFTDLLGVDVATVKKVLAQLGPGPLRRAAGQGRQGAAPRRQAGGRADSARVRPGRRQPPHLDRLRIGPVLERLRRRHRDARLGRVLRRASRQQGAIRRLEQERLAQHERARRSRTSRRASWPRCTTTSCRSRRPRRPRARSTPAAFERGKAVFAGRRAARAATCRRCSPSPATTCTRRARSASTRSRPIARPPAPIARRRWRACGRTRRAASITTAVSRR